jgi:hypothetical protein
LRRRRRARPLAGTTTGTNPLMRATRARSPTAAPRPIPGGPPHRNRPRPGRRLLEQLPDASHLVTCNRHQAAWPGDTVVISGVSEVCRVSRRLPAPGLESFHTAAQAVVHEARRRSPPQPEQPIASKRPSRLLRSASCRGRDQDDGRSTCEVDDASVRINHETIRYEVHDSCWCKIPSARIPSECVRPLSQSVQFFRI